MRKTNYSTWGKPMTAVIRICSAFAFCVVWLAFARPALADNYPERTVRIIIPFSAGGAADTMLRLVAQHLQEKWGQSVVVDNRPGGNSIVGTVVAARAAPDGYTLYFASDQSITINPALYALPYDPKKDFVPITLMGAIPHILAVHKDLPVGSVGEFVRMAKAQPNKLMYGSAGPGSTQRLAMEYFSRLAGVELVHVPYKGSNELTMGVVGGQAHALFNGALNIAPHMQTGALRGLAISTTRRVPQFPDLPTVQEAGVPQFSSQGWFGMMAPNGVPKPLLANVEVDIAEILNRADVRTKLEQRGFLVHASSAEAFAGFLADETDKWSRLVKEANIRPN
jgi:tripartite-type tricarboxylate transporter receptor subunit TctC